EVIEGPARPPRPRLEHAPIVHLARLSLVAQADDSLRQARAVIRLHAVGNDDGITPSLGEHLLLPGRPGRPLGLGKRSNWAFAFAEEAAEAELHHHGNRA